LHRLVQDDVQPAAMDSDLRKGISGKLSAIFAIDQLPETIEERAIAVFNSRLEQCVAQSKCAELAHGMRKQLMPTPSSLISGARSYTRQAMPRSFRLRASDSPQMPPPTIATSIPSRQSAAPLYSGLTSTLRNLIEPAPCCSTIGPSSNMPLRSFAVVSPLSTTVMSRPFAVTS